MITRVKDISAGRLSCLGGSVLKRDRDWKFPLRSGPGGIGIKNSFRFRTLLGGIFKVLFG